MALWIVWQKFTHYDQLFGLIFEPHNHFFNYWFFQVMYLFLIFHLKLQICIFFHPPETAKRSSYLSTNCTFQRHFVSFVLCISILHRELIATRLESLLKLISISNDPVAYKGFEQANGLARLWLSAIFSTSHIITNEFSRLAGTPT